MRLNLILKEYIKTPSQWIRNLSSTAIKRYKYKDGKLYVEFYRNDNQTIVYVYDNVPVEVFSEFVNSKSMGRAYHKLIRGKFKSEKVTVK